MANSDPPDTRRELPRHMTPSPDTEASALRAVRNSIPVPPDQIASLKAQVAEMAAQLRERRFNESNLRAQVAEMGAQLERIDSEERVSNFMIENVTFEANPAAPPPSIILPGKLGRLSKWQQRALLAAAEAAVIALASAVGSETGWTQQLLGFLRSLW